MATDFLTTKRRAKGMPAAGSNHPRLNTLGRLETQALRQTHEQQQTTRSTHGERERERDLSTPALKRATSSSNTRKMDTGYEVLRKALS